MAKQDWEIKLESDIASIGDQLIRGRASFLFGAGMSIDSGGIPSRELALRLVMRGFYRHLDLNGLENETKTLIKEIREAVDRYPIEAVASAAELELPFQETELTNMLQEVVFDDKTPKEHQGHKDLATLVQRLRYPRLMFTTNWDKLIEDSMGGIAFPITNSNFADLDLEDLLREKVGIVHLHGVFGDAPLIKEEDLMSIDKPLFSLFLAELMSKCFVFVGYSLSDPNIRSLYFRVNKVLTSQRIQLRKQTYVVSPCISDADRRIASATWRAPQRRAIHIPLRADEFFNRLRTYVQGKAIRSQKEKIADRLGIEVKDLDMKIEEVRAVFPDLGETKLVLDYLDEMTRGGSQ